MPTQKWTFKSRFRANAYGWKGTALATKRLKEAVSEIKKVNKTDPVAGAEGVVSLMERLWPALQGIDSSSGALSTAANRTLEALIPLLVSSPANKETRAKWLDRLFEAVVEDGVDYLSPVTDRWGCICGSEELANDWANRMLPELQAAWSNEGSETWVKGGTLCLSCLLATRRYDELYQLLTLRKFRFWPFDKFWAQALADQGKTDEAIEFAESCRIERSSYDDGAIVEFCEGLLLASGRADEAYRRYGMQASQSTTNLSTYRRIARKYPDLEPRQILLDLIETRPPAGKWFAASTDAGCLDVAFECAKDTSADPSTLTRAARDFVEKDPHFSANVALLAINNLLAGGGYEPTPLDVLKAHHYLATAAAACGQREWANAELDRLIERWAASDRQALLKALAAATMRS